VFRFFFQAEDGIRAFHVTGVQTCALPIYRECRTQAADEPRTCSPIKLGLDLQGGMHLALEVADPEGTLTHEAKVDATDRALKIIRTRIDEFGVAEPLIQKVGDDRIIVELPGIREEGRAKEIIQRTAFLEWRL